MTKTYMIMSRNPNNLNISKKEVLEDYKLASISRQVSLIGRREVLTGKAKFGMERKKVKDELKFKKIKVVR